MAQRKPFLLRLDPATHEALQRWADAELRSLNAQIEFLLRRALREEGRLSGEAGPHVVRDNAGVSDGGKEPSQ
jgi:hypothetical protein